MKTITIFGGNQASPADLQDAEELGRRIGRKGYTLKNGGYHGIMEATAKGCVEAGGKVIGICVEGNFNNQVTPNKYSTKVIHARSLDERIQELLKTDAAIVMPGGLGTLMELTYAWGKKAAGSTFPIYIYGQKYKLLLTNLEEQSLVQREYLELVQDISSLDELDKLI